MQRYGEADVADHSKPVQGGHDTRGAQRDPPFGEAVGEIIHHPWEFEETGDTTDNPFGEKNEKLYRLVDKETDEEREHNSKVFDRTRELEEQEWNELWQILKGQDIEEYKEFEKTLTEEQKKETDQYYKWFDGSGLRGWWD